MDRWKTESHIYGYLLLYLYFLPDGQEIHPHPLVEQGGSGEEKKELSD